MPRRYLQPVPEPGPETDIRFDEQRGQYCARFEGLLLTSAFQPVFSVAHGRPAGHEGLVRAFSPDGQPVSPAALFSSAERGRAGIRHLDQTCQALHLQNAGLAGTSAGWAFLNIHADVVQDADRFERDFEALLSCSGLSPCRLVVELLEDAIEDGACLERAVTFLRDIGCLVAVDDFGAGHSNFDRIWRIRPDIVKLDRNLIRETDTNAEARRILPGLVSLIHEAGALVVAEGIETAHQALVAMESNVDFVQGFRFGRPVAAGRLETGPSAELDADRRRFGEEEAARARRSETELARLKQVFERSARALAGTDDIAAVCSLLMEMEEVENAYLLDGEGFQIGSTYAGRHARNTRDLRFAPVENGQGANWSRRPYFRRARREPGRVHISRPYLSINNGLKTVTLSFGLEAPAGLRIFCVDVRADKAAEAGCTVP